MGLRVGEDVEEDTMQPEDNIVTLGRQGNNSPRALAFVEPLVVAFGAGGACLMAGHCAASVLAEG